MMVPLSAYSGRYQFGNETTPLYFRYAFAMARSGRSHNVGNLALPSVAVDRWSFFVDSALFVVKEKSRFSIQR